jgi:hypothetical protein
MNKTREQWTMWAEKRKARAATPATPSPEVSFDISLQREYARQSGAPFGEVVNTKASKYGNVKTDGEASKKQARRLFELRLMNEAGQIRGLARQVEYVLIPKYIHECGELMERKISYLADFQYEELTKDGWRLVVEDVKGFATPGYIMKRKLMLSVHGIVIRET